MRATDSHRLSNWVYIGTYLLVINFFKEPVLVLDSQKFGSLMKTAVL
jgi:hypothetical protein